MGLQGWDLWKQPRVLVRRKERSVAASREKLGSAAVLPPAKEPQLPTEARIRQLMDTLLRQHPMVSRPPPKVNAQMEPKNIDFPPGLDEAAILTEISRLEFSVLDAQTRIRLLHEGAASSSE